MLNRVIGVMKRFYWAMVRSERYHSLMARIAVTDHIDRLQGQYRGTKRLEPHGFKVYSQADEDGIIQEIFIRIGTTDRRFIEVGAHDGSENCTAYLLHQGWSGLWLDAGENTQTVARHWPKESASGQVKFQAALIDPDNVNPVFEKAGVTGEIDLLVFDIDGNDYHVLKRLTAVKPRVICLEYNAHFPPPYRWVMPYNPAHHFDGSHVFGASLSAYDDLMRERGYTLVGCCLTGANAFFVRSDLTQDKFAEPATPEHLYQPPRFYLAYQPFGMRYGFSAGRSPPQLWKP